MHAVFRVFLKRLTVDSYFVLDISFIHQACNYNYVDLTQTSNIWLAPVLLAHPCIYNSLAYLPRTHNLDIRTRALSLSSSRLSARRFNGAE